MNFHYENVPGESHAFLCCRYLQPFQISVRLILLSLLYRQKKLRELKESVVKEKIGWFHSETDNIDRPLCPHNLDALVER